MHNGKPAALRITAHRDHGGIGGRALTRFVMLALCVLAVSSCQKPDPSGEAAIAAADQLSDAARVELQLPARGALTLATAADRETIKALAPEVHAAVGAHLKQDTATWQIVAARPIGKYLLLWIAFPKVADGGVDLIYSVEKKRIVGAFLGGYRG